MKARHAIVIFLLFVPGQAQRADWIWKSKAFDLQQQQGDVGQIRTFSSIFTPPKPHLYQLTQSLYDQDQLSAPELSTFSEILGLKPKSASSRIRGRSLSSSWSDLSLFNNEVGTDGDPDSSSYTDSVLDVIHPDSPYGLIQDVLPSSKTRPTNKFSRNRHPDSIFDLRGFNELDGLDPEEVWLSDGNLLVLKGGTTPNKSGFDNVWEPLDDYEAPYREPVLAPPDAKVTLTSDLGQYAVVVPPPKTSPPPSTHRVPRVQVHSKSGQGVVFQSDGWIPTTGQVQVHPAKPRFQRHSLIDTKVQSEPKHQQQQQVAWMPFLGTFVKASKVQDNLVESSNDVMDHVAVMPRGQKVYSYPQLPKQSSSLRHYARQSAIKRMSIQPPLHPYHHQRPPTTLQQNRFQFLRRFLRQ